MLCLASFEQSEFPHYTHFHTPQKQNTSHLKPSSNDRKKEMCKFNRKCLQCLKYLNKMATLEKLIRWCLPVLYVMESIFLGKKEGESKKKGTERNKKPNSHQKKIYNWAGKATFQVSAKDTEFQLTGLSNLLLCFGHQVKMLQRKAGPIQLCPEFSKCDELSLEKELSIWPYCAQPGFSIFSLPYYF